MTKYDNEYQESNSAFVVTDVDLDEFTASGYWPAKKFLWFTIKPVRYATYFLTKNTTGLQSSYDWHDANGLQLHIFLRGTLERAWEAEKWKKDNLDRLP